MTWTGSLWNYVEFVLIVLCSLGEVIVAILVMRIKRLKKDSHKNAQIIEKLDSWVESLIFITTLIACGLKMM